jgi:lactate racemase
MDTNRELQHVCLPYGKGEIEVSLPVNKNTYIISPPDYPGTGDVEGLIREALKQPIGSLTLPEQVRTKKAGNACIIVNDITRPTPTGPMLRAIARELNASGIPDSHINVLVATGTHRGNTPEELGEMLGAEAMERFRVVNHDCMDDRALVQVGTTGRGIPVVINRIFAGADLRIATGIITPHQGAGFSGGRKSVMPGIAGLPSLKRHHGAELRASTPVHGKIDGNLFHQEALEAARIAGLDFIVNSVPNYKKETVAVVAGDLEKAWLEGVKYARKVSEVSVPCHADITIVHCGGHPRDFNLYQAQKSIASAELITRPGGIVIVLGECSDGIGSDTVQKWLGGADNPKQVMDRFTREGFSPGTSKARAFARALLNFRVFIVTRAIPPEILEQMFMQCYPDLESALAEAYKYSGSDRVLVLLRNAAGVIPVIKA